MQRRRWVSGERVGDIGSDDQRVAAVRRAVRGPERLRLLDQRSVEAEVDVVGTQAGQAAELTGVLGGLLAEVRRSSGAKVLTRDEEDATVTNDALRQ